MTDFIQQHLAHSEQLLRKFRKVDETQTVWHKLPQIAETWNVSSHHSGHKYHQAFNEFSMHLEQAKGGKKWKWPKRPIFFIADPHADPDAFAMSLLATGGVTLTDNKKQSFKLTSLGKKAIFIIGGDCLDKGPNNLGLLDKIKQLMDCGARVKLLAGNHDMRLYMGIHSMGMKQHPSTEHLFVRMGEKVLPLLTEIHDRYLKDKKLPKSIPDEHTCKTLLFPRSEWFEQFPKHAETLMTDAGIQRELRKMKRKYDHFEQACLDAGFTMRDVYAIALKCRQLFLSRKGDYNWFYRRMQLSYRRGSFLFLHAGLDDAISHDIEQKGVASLNKRFRREIKHDLFSFYYGSLANTMRTKYRNSDLPLTSAGVEKVNKQGIYAIVQGHINRRHGQRIVLKQGLLHIESDVTLDRHSRDKEGLKGIGAGVTIIHPDKKVLGVSTDYPFAKVFNPDFYQLDRERTH
jgi:hypothetical protein